ncbi:cytochrome c peroxidase [Dyadobacter arcticus]|uniref:cytochrome c peroxidase n=1 Tax=Dyadobacter arcticus TaxID=1078754 RepID=UPI00141E6DD8
MCINNKDKGYFNSFRNAFHKKPNDKIKKAEIYKAIAAYIRTLNPQNSRFDQYINGKSKTLTENEIGLPNIHR